jgi:hypothetical protein
MKTLGWLRQQVVDWIEDDSDRQIIYRAINNAIDIVTADTSFSALNTNVTVTPDSEGVLIVPPRCQDINEIFPSSDGRREAPFVFTGARRVQTDGRKPGYFYRSYGCVETPLATLDADFTLGSSIVSQSTASSEDFLLAHVGEEFVIAGGDEVYRIDAFDDQGLANTFTIYPDYRYSNQTDLPCYVRPASKEQICLYDSLGNPYAQEVIIEYRQRHPRLINEADILLIPAPHTVALEAVRFFLRQTKYDVDAERLERLALKYSNLEGAKQPAKMEPNFRANDDLFQTPGRGRHGYKRGR